MINYQTIKDSNDSYSNYVIKKQSIEKDNNITPEIKNRLNSYNSLIDTFGEVLVLKNYNEIVNRYKHSKINIDFKRIQDNAQYLVRNKTSYDSSLFKTDIYRMSYFIID